jgi:hypothetical protein
MKTKTSKHRTCYKNDCITHKKITSQKITSFRIGVSERRSKNEMKENGSFWWSFSHTLNDNYTRESRFSFLYSPFYTLFKFLLRSFSPPLLYLAGCLMNVYWNRMELKFELSRSVLTTLYIRPAQLVYALQNELKKPICRQFYEPKMMFSDEIWYLWFHLGEISDSSSSCGLKQLKLLGIHFDFNCDIYQL